MFSRFSFFSCVDLVQHEFGGGHGSGHRQELLVGDGAAERVHLLLRHLLIGQILDGRERRVGGQDLVLGELLSKNSRVGRLAGRVERFGVGVHGLLVRLRGFGFSLRYPVLSIFFQD